MKLLLVLLLLRLPLLPVLLLPILLLVPILLCGPLPILTAARSTADLRLLLCLLLLRALLVLLWVCALLTKLLLLGRCCIAVCRRIQQRRWFRHTSKIHELLHPSS